MSLSRRILLAAGVAAGWPALRAQARIERLGPATQLPAWEARDLDGKPLPVPAQGKATVVNFWASWCAPCLVEMPQLRQMAEFYSDRVALQAVNYKERAVAVRRHVTAAGWTMPVLLDPAGAGAETWGVKVFPTTIGFDAAGRARWRVVGAYDWSGVEAGRLVESLWA